MRVSALVALFALISFQRPAIQHGDSLQNLGFESATTHEGWSLHVYGTQPSVTLDSEIRREGRQSLRISSAELSDTALGQELRLKAGHWYRFTGWVRTRGLNPHGAPVYGTYQIQLPGGRGVIASGQNHDGETNW